MTPSHPVRPRSDAPEESGSPALRAPRIAPPSATPCPWIEGVPDADRTGSAPGTDPDRGGRPRAPDAARRDPGRSQAPPLAEPVLWYVTAAPAQAPAAGRHGGLRVLRRQDGGQREGW